MISRDKMFKPLLSVSEGFKPIWNDFLEEWKDDDELPLYLVLSDLARYISTLLSKGNDKELKNIFMVIERWHLEGDAYVKEAAKVGVLEDLQNTNVVGNEVPEKVELYLLPESRKSWFELYEFWEMPKINNDLKE